MDRAGEVKVGVTHAVRGELDGGGKVTTNRTSCILWIEWVGRRLGEWERLYWLVFERTVLGWMGR